MTATLSVIDMTPMILMAIGLGLGAVGMLWMTRRLGRLRRRGLGDRRAVRSDRVVTRVIAERMQAVGKLVALEVHAKEIATATSGWAWLPPLLLSQARLAMIFNFEKQYYVDLRRVREEDVELVAEVDGAPVGDRRHGGTPVGDRWHGGAPVGDRWHGGEPVGDRRHGGEPVGDRWHGGAPVGDRWHRGRFRVTLPEIEGALRLCDVTPYDIQNARVLGLLDVIPMTADRQRDLMKRAQAQAAELYETCDERYRQQARLSAERHLKALMELFGVEVEVAWRPARPAKPPAGPIPQGCLEAAA